MCLKSKMENITFIFKQKKSIPYQIASFMVLLYGIILIQYFIFGGIIIGIGSLIFISVIEGIEIDFNSRKYRNAKFIGKLTIGNWQNLPEINYISVFRTTITRAIVGRSEARVSSSERVIIINLIYDKNKKLRVYKTKDYKDAFKKAELFSQKLNLRIFDATEKIGKWIE